MKVAPPAKGRGRAFLCGSLIVLLLCAWLLFFGCKAVAVPIFRPKAGPRAKAKQAAGIRPAPPERAAPVIFVESKRPVPSCPDPLHNRR
ncbi:hypothetical protein AXF42_Ash014153 [Apostasia shenzhenica]|uniref:Uncharacterized protein n=1 Tax=Apostasia shenzhenica TaxID=1088818 RepID=A0A2I0A133_9ASPA|nr:hypothetical protein AXF42_Ash014153 [Apostasia shenzhenica]